MKFRLQLPATLRGVILMIVLAALSLSASAQFEPDSLQTSDSLKTDTSPLQWLADSTEISPDSVASAGIIQRWLQPMGVILVAGTTIVLLFTVRSK